MNKPSINPITGCAHIQTISFIGCKFRVCSWCNAEVPKDVEEARINYCWDCGNAFDHTDDDPKEE